jgi:hypothetical protein
MLIAFFNSSVLACFKYLFTEADHLRHLYRALSGLVVDPPSLPSSRRATVSTIQAAANASYHIEREYTNWCDSLDPDLRPNLPPANAHAAVLALRGLTMRLLLHRPLVLAAIRQQFGIQSRAPSPEARQHLPTQRSLDLQQRNIAFGMSVAAVIETSVLIVGLLDASTRAAVVLSAPWYQLFYGTSLTW